MRVNRGMKYSLRVGEIQTGSLTVCEAISTLPHAVKYTLEGLWCDKKKALLTGGNLTVHYITQH